VSKVDLKKDANAIKKLILKIGSPIIPLTLIFEGLGFNGVTGLERGIRTGFVSALTTELGYEAQRLGRSAVLARHKQI
jgi:hypothetical protein